jgi:hypothetical protein
MKTELMNRYERCLKVLARARHAMMREAWQDGPTESEVIPQINELLNEPEEDKEAELADINRQIESFDRDLIGCRNKYVKDRIYREIARLQARKAAIQSEAKEAA